VSSNNKFTPQLGTKKLNTLKILNPTSKTPLFFFFFLKKCCACLCYTIKIKIFFIFYFLFILGDDSTSFVILLRTNIIESLLLAIKAKKKKKKKKNYYVEITIEPCKISHIWRESEKSVSSQTKNLEKGNVKTKTMEPT
jgi:Na+/melibiose symporter-like transporter